MLNNRNYQSAFLKRMSEKYSQVFYLSSSSFISMSALDSVYAKTTSLKALFERSAKLEDVFEFTNDLETILLVLKELQEIKKRVEETNPTLLLEIIEIEESYEKKVGELEKQGRLVRFLTNNRLRKQLDQMHASLRQKVDELRETSRVKTPYAPIPSPEKNPRESNFSVSDPKLDVVWNAMFGVEKDFEAWKEFVSQLKKKVAVNDIEETLLQNVLDQSNTGLVTRSKFSQFMKAFGPLSECIKNVVKLVTCAWFHFYITPEQSKKFLEPENVGSYLVRFSGTKPGAFALDYVASSVDVPTELPSYGAMILKRDSFHGNAVTVQPHPNYGASPTKVVVSVLIEGVGVGFKMKENQQEKMFKSLSEIVNYYTNQKLLVKPYTSTLSRESWFAGDLSAEEAEELLISQKPGTFLIRFSSQPGYFAASFIDSASKLCKSLIKRVHGGFIVEGGAESKIYPSIQDLVKDFEQMQLFLYPCTNAVSDIKKRVRTETLGGFAPIAQPSAPIIKNQSQAPTKRSNYGSSLIARGIEECVCKFLRNFSGISTWSADDVQKWLDSMNLGDLKETFKQHKINGVALQSLTEEDMKNELKLVVGHRKIIMKGLQDLQ